MRIRLSSPVFASELSELLQLTAPLSPLTSFSHLVTDSREAASGDLFISLTKDHQLSQKHILDAKLRGAYTVGPGGDFATLDTEGALLGLTSLIIHRQDSLKYTVAITGSVGKTTAKNMLSSIASTGYKVHSNEGNKNNSIGMPLTVLSAPSYTEALILELGMNHRGEISRLSRSVEPNIAVITSIGTAHIGNLGSRDEILKAKLEVADGMRGGWLIYPAKEKIRDLNVNTVSFSTDGTTADAMTRVINATNSDIDFLFMINGEEYEMHFPVGAPHLLPSLTAALSAAYLMNIAPEDIARAVAAMTGECVRHKVRQVRGITVLDDSYNASFESVSAALSYLMTFPNKTHYALLGDMLELGTYSAELHYGIGECVAQAGIDRLFLLGDYAEDIKMGAVDAGMPSERILMLEKADKNERIAQIIRMHVEDGGIILVKASHGTGISEIAELMTGGENE